MSTDLGPTSARRLFAAYALVTLLPVLLLGGLLFRTAGRQAEDRGLQQATDHAVLFSDAVVAPSLNGHSLDDGLTPAERAAVDRSVLASVSNGSVIRLRLRGVNGLVTYASDGTNGGGVADDEALDAAKGEPSTSFTTDQSDIAAGRGRRAVESYQPIRSPRTGQVLGVLEVYLPYDGIAAEVRADRHQQLLVIALGLGTLWLVLLGVSTSVSRRQRRTARTNAHLAAHDGLTGLPNRSTFTVRAAQAITQARQDRPAALAIIDLDRFKQVNDTLGHSIGDSLLCVLADRLRAAVREGELVARLGGDEFGVVLPFVEDSDGALTALTRLRGVLAEPLTVEDLPLSVESSIGFVVVPGDGTDVDELLTRADVAMYAAKHGHLGVVQHDQSQPHLESLTLRLIGELAQAIDDGQLVLHYQPKTDLLTQRVTAVEALVRWQHPERGLLYPDAFLLAAEQTELIEPLTRWVLREAARTLPLLDPSGELSVAVNISARSLSRLDFADDVLSVLAETGTDPRRVLLEITETALLSDPDRALSTLNRLTSRGVRISIDDFGAGQTSLGYLASLPVSELKIDRAFVTSMAHDPRNAAIVRWVIELGHNLGFSVTAEGVETGEVLDRLCDAQCDLVQGYYLGRPVPAGDLELSVKAWTR